MYDELAALEGAHTPKISDFWSWVRKAFTPSYQNEVEMYLKDSVDHKDLQTRVDILIRRGMI
jgi:hypothetical protein